MEYSNSFLAHEPHKACRHAGRVCLRGPREVGNRNFKIYITHRMFPIYHD